MSSPGMRLTRAGKLALAASLTGKELNFRRIEIGSGDFDYETENVADLTELRHFEMALPLTKVEVQGDGTCYLQAHLDNASVYQGFPAREHGLIAIDPITGEEILYSYRNSGDEYDFIPSNTGSAHKNIFVEYIVEIQDATEITATLDLSLSYVGTEDFDKHVNDKHPHPNAPSHYDDVTSTDAIWVADNDKHLHLMKLGNFKNLLAESEGATIPAARVLSDAEKIFNAKTELGLDANMLIAEDFSEPDTVDSFKVRVTSSAENGRLLGVEDIEGIKTGAYYTLSDNINQEIVKIASLVHNISGYHARLAEPLLNSYDWQGAYLARTTTGGAEKKTLSWIPTAGFTGYEANIARTITLETQNDKKDDFEITDDGILTVDGFFTLAG